VEGVSAPPANGLSRRRWRAGNFTTSAHMAGFIFRSVFFSNLSANFLKVFQTLFLADFYNFYSLSSRFSYKNRRILSFF
jgi:hypothetical protein